jgi:hypothetical protein
MLEPVFWQSAALLDEEAALYTSTAWIREKA